MSRGESRSYILRNSLSGRLAGLRERFVVARFEEEGSRLVVEGDLCGRVEIPLEAMTHVRVGWRPGVRSFYRCTIRRAGARWPLALRGERFNPAFSDFVLRLGRELNRRGRLDRVARGLPIWHAVLLLLISCIALLPLAFHTWLWLSFGQRMNAEQTLFLAGASLFWAGLFVWALWVWRRRYWPRPVRSVDDLAEFLP